MTTQPEIRIRYAWLLSEAASEPLNELWGEGKPLLTPEEYEAIADNYEKAWRPYEKKILKGIQDITGLEFRQDIIDVYIAPWFMAFSDPMVIGVIYEPDVFIDTLTHELIHRLLTDNKQTPYDKDLIPVWEKLFGKDHDWNALVHIPVHSINKAVYLDILNEPSRLERDIESAHTDPEDTAYAKAWDYVNEHDYKEINQQIRESYIIKHR